MTKLTEIRTDSAPAPIGPYSQAQKVGGFSAVDSRSL